MPDLSRGASRRLVVFAGAVALLAVPTPAEGALHGPAFGFTTRPVLRSVTFNARVASFTFDRAVQASRAFGAGSFAIGGYRAGVVIGQEENTVANVSISDPRTVLVTYTGTTPDFDAATFGAVADAAVEGRDAPRLPVLADSAPVTGATGQSGVRGHSAGPDLQSVSPDPENNRFTFTFDQSVLDEDLSATWFRFADVGGTMHPGLSITDVDGANVTVGFEQLQSLARRAMVVGSVLSRDGATAAPPAFSVAVPGRPSLTNGPALVSAARESGSVFLLTFDQPVTAIGDIAGLQAVTSNGATMAAVAGSIASSTVVRAVFPEALDFEIEHVVALSVAAGAVSGGGPSLATGVAFGGNAGARATGFTTAPDPIAATINRATGQVTVVFDSRLSATPPAAAYAGLAPDGSFTATASAVRVIQGDGPTQPRVVLQFTPAQAAATAVLRLGGNVVTDGRFVTEAGAAATGTILPGGADAQSLHTLFVPADTADVY